MQTMTLDAAPARRLPLGLRAIAVLGIVWNAYGVVQFVRSTTATPASLMADGLTQAQAELYLGLPAWIGAAFAVGVLAGLLGCLALAARRAVAQRLLAVSLVGYVALFAGDAWFGLFSAMPAQLGILSVVLMVAVALSLAARAAGRQGLLR